MLVSGLDLAGSADVLFPFELLVDWVSGWLGDVGEQKNQALVSRILFAGKCSNFFFCFPFLCALSYILFFSR